jgi:hypothetical protein
MRNNFYSTEHETIRVQFNGEVTTVEIIDNNGVAARGHAKHNPADSYSESFGQALALARASNRYFRKIEKRLVKETK